MGIATGSYGEEYQGRKWREWQQRWDETPLAQKQIIGEWAAVHGIDAASDPKALLKKLADVHTGGATFDSIQGETNTQINKVFEVFYSDLKDASSRNPYDESEWTKEKIKEDFISRWKMEDYNQSALPTVGEVISTRLSNDITTKIDAGTHDPETGKPYEEGKGAVDWTEQTDSIFSDSGLAKEDHPELYDKLYDMFKKNELDPYEAKQWFEGTKEFVEQEYKRQYAEFAPKIDEATQRRLAIIEEEGARTAKQLNIEFERITPELAATAKQYGGMTREDTYISDTLARYKGEMESERGTYMEGLRIQEKMAGEQQKAALEAGEFETLKGMTSEAQTQALKMYQRTLDEKARTQEAMASLSMQKSAMLAQRAQDRYEREQEKQRKRLERQALDAQNKAYKKARRLGAWVQPVISAVGGFAGGGPVGAVVGAGAAYAQQRYQQTMAEGDVQAPSTLSLYEQSSRIGAGTQDYWNQLKNWNTNRYARQPGYQQNISAFSNL